VQNLLVAAALALKVHLPINLYLTPIFLMIEAERTAEQLEKDVAHKLTLAQQQTLMDLLQKIYL
jgi:hypothetical protein